MRCQICDGKARVIESRTRKDGTRRRKYKCDEHGHVFSTELARTELGKRIESILGIGTLVRTKEQSQELAQKCIELREKKMSYKMIAHTLNINPSYVPILISRYKNKLAKKNTWASKNSIFQS